MASAVRPVRPSAAPATEALARKLTAEPARISIRVAKSTLRSLQSAARRADKQSMKAFVMDLFVKAGVQVAPEDLEEDG